MAKTTEPEAPAEETEVTFTPKDLAERCETDPKTFRKWLRRQTDARAGKGGRWTFDAETADALVAAYLQPKEDDEEPADDDE